MLLMATHKYHYHGDTDVHLPLHGIFAKGGDATTVYESDLKIEHPDFKEVYKSEHKRKESQADK